MTGLLQDLRHAFRVFRKAPAFSLVAVATLALGIGANTAIFSVVQGLLLSPLPYPDSQRLVTIWQDMRKLGGPIDEWGSPGSYVDWKSRTDLFSAVTAVRGWNASLTGTGAPAEAIAGEQVTHEYFDVLRVAPALGRAFTAADDVPNAPRVAILGHGLWLRKFGGDRGIVGRTITLSGEPHEVIGVMPEDFRPAIIASAEVWRPNRLNTASPSRGAIFLRIVARLRDGVTFEQASGALASFAVQLEREHPESNLNVGVNVVRMHDRVVGAVRPALLALVGAVALVLLIACVNVANLLLARASSRGREIAVRMALGAGRSRVVRQMLTESAVLAAAGGIAGVLLGSWGVAVLLASAPAGVPHVGRIGVNGPVLLYAAGVTIATAFLFGLVPAWQSARQQVADRLKEGGRGMASPAGRRTRRALVVAEVALALMLLVGGGLLLRTFVELQRTPLGFDPDHVLAGFVQPPPTRYASREERIALYDRLLESASTLPGVSEAALSSIIPLGGDNDTNFEIEGRAAPSPGERPAVAWYRLVSAGYFHLMGLTLRGGRLFPAGEPEPVIVVNETMARRYWPGGNALGKRIRPSQDGPWFTIVGIVNDMKSRGAMADAQVEMFVPYWQIPEAGVNVLVKTSGNPALLSGSLRDMVASIDRDLPLGRVTTLNDVVAGSIEQPRFFAVLAGVFGVLALALAGIGLYGVMAFTVAQRRMEIGVRLALGAAQGRIFALVVGDGLKLAGIGLAIGLVAAAGVGRALRNLLFGVRQGDPLTLVVTALVLVAVALAASYLPARRAMRVDPMEALRAE